MQSTSPEKSRRWFPRRLRSTEQKATLVLTSPEGSGKLPGLSAQGEKWQQGWGLSISGVERVGYKAGATLTCTHVLLKLVPHVHKLPEEGWPGKPLGPSCWCFYFTQVQCPLEAGGRQLPALLLLIRCRQQFCQVPPPCHYGPCQPAWTPKGRS